MALTLILLIKLTTLIHLSLSSPSNILLPRQQAQQQAQQQQAQAGSQPAGTTPASGQNVAAANCPNTAPPPAEGAPGSASARQQTLQKAQAAAGDPNTVATFTYYALSAAGDASCCGPAGVPWQQPDSGPLLTAAPSQYIYNTINRGACGKACGNCFKLTNLCVDIDDPNKGCQGTETTKAVVVMATNSCPPEKDPCDIVTNGVGWCESLNKYGLKAHFDIAKGAAAAQINGWGHTYIKYELWPCTQSADAQVSQTTVSRKTRRQQAAGLTSNGVTGNNVAGNNAVGNGVAGNGQAGNGLAGTTTAAAGDGQNVLTQNYAAQCARCPIQAWTPLDGGIGGPAGSSVGNTGQITNL